MYIASVVPLKVPKISAKNHNAAPQQGAIKMMRTTNERRVTDCVR